MPNSKRPTPSGRSSYAFGGPLSSVITPRRSLLLVLLLFLANGYLLRRATEHLSKNFDWVAHTFEVQSAIYKVEADVISFNRRIRTVWIAQQAAPDDPTFDALLMQDADRVQQFTTYNPSQQSRVQQLRALLKAHLTIVAKRTPDPASIGQFEAKLDGSSGQVLEQLRLMNAEESRLLKMRQVQTVATERQIELGLLEETAGGVLLSVLVYGYVMYRRRREHASEIRQNLLIDQLRDYSVVKLDSRGRVVDYSLSTLAITGFGRQELVGADHSIFYTAEDQARGVGGNALLEANRSGRMEQEVLQRRESGPSYWAEVLIYPFYQGEALKGYSRLSRDITERRNLLGQIQRSAELLEQKVAQRTAELEQANTALSAFNSTVSHDLKTPLRAIWGFARALQQDFEADLSPVAKEYVDTIIASSKRMDVLIRDLLAFSRAEDAQLTLTEVDLTDVALTAIKNLALPASDDPPEIEVPERLPKVRGAYSPLVQCFFNLLSNGVQYASPGRPARIVIRASEVFNNMITFILSITASESSGAIWANCLFPSPASTRMNIAAAQELGSRW